MSKLPNAPLVEVVLELRWNIISKDDIIKIQYLHGDIYNKLKTKYPYRELIAPPEIPMDILINKPVHRFRAEKNDYPLIQLGPGVITLNTIDNKYFWNEFSTSAEELFSTFLEVYPVSSTERFSPAVIFVDFFAFNFEKENVYEFLNKNFSIDFNQNFIKVTDNPSELNMGYYYNIELGNLSVTFQKGKNSVNNEGIVLQTRLVGKPLNPNIKEIMKWHSDSHDICSDLFKELTKGKLYESFKMK